MSLVYVFVFVMCCSGRYVNGSCKEDDNGMEHMIVFGILYPFQLHVLYLGYLSIKQMRLRLRMR